MNRNVIPHPSKCKVSAATVRHAGKSCVVQEKSVSREKAAHMAFRDNDELFILLVGSGWDD